MTGLRDILASHVDSGYLPGAVGLVAHGDRVEVAAVGSAGIGDFAPMARDTIFRVASLTKPIAAAAAMLL
ncbi:serine hydrolase, partial [Streptomyces sp. NPDC091259]